MEVKIEHNQIITNEEENIKQARQVTRGLLRSWRSRFTQPTDGQSMWCNYGDVAIASDSPKHVEVRQMLPDRTNTFTFDDETGALSKEVAPLSPDAPLYDVPEPTAAELYADLNWLLFDCDDAQRQGQ